MSTLPQFPHPSFKLFFVNFCKKKIFKKISRIFSSKYWKKAYKWSVGVVRGCGTPHLKMFLIHIGCHVYLNMSLENMLLLLILAKNKVQQRVVNLCTVCRIWLPEMNGKIWLSRLNNQNLLGIFQYFDVFKILAKVFYNSWMVPYLLQIMNQSI